MVASYAKACKNRGVAVGGLGVWTNPPPHGPEKVCKNRFFSFLFFFWAGSHRKASSLKRTEGRRKQKTSHARRGMARFEWHFAQMPSPPKKTSHRPTCKTRRGQVRMPNPVLSVGIVLQQNSVDQRHGEHPAAQTDKRTAQMPSCSVERCWNHCGSERAARTREKEGCQRERCVERVRLFAKKVIVVRQWPQRDGNESVAARGRRQLFAIVPPATNPRRKKLFTVVFIDSSKCLTNSNFCSRWPAKCFSGIEWFR